MANLPALPARIQDKIAPEPNSGCWLWTSEVGAGGYGRVWFERRAAMAHRVVYELTVGPIPVRLTLDHLCRVRNCVNPSHLEPVAFEENVLRGDSFSARYARRTHCPKGHALSGSNVYRRSDHGRACHECDRVRGRSRYAAGYRSPSWVKARGSNAAN